MTNTSAQALDIDLTPHDLQALNGAEAVAAFFARLGNDIDMRTPQDPGTILQIGEQRGTIHTPSAAPRPRHSAIWSMGISLS